jgi:hypothetical protein
MSEHKRHDREKLSQKRSPIRLIGMRAHGVLPVID